MAKKQTTIHLGNMRISLINDLHMRMVPSLSLPRLMGKLSLMDIGSWPRLNTSRANTLSKPPCSYAFTSQYTPSLHLMLYVSLCIHSSIQSFTLALESLKGRPWKHRETLLGNRAAAYFMLKRYAHVCSVVSYLIFKTLNRV